MIPRIISTQNRTVLNKTIERCVLTWPSVLNLGLWDHALNQVSSRRLLPAYPLGQRVHLPRLGRGVLLAEAVVELHQQPLGERLAGAVDAAVVEDLGVLAADAHRVGRAAVQVGALALPPLQGHPAERRAAWEHGQR